MSNTMRLIIPTYSDNVVKYDVVHHSSACPLVLGSRDEEQSRLCKSSVRVFTNLQRAKNA